MAAAPTTVSLRLLVDKTAPKVVFAEADKPFVDFLFHLMSLPIGTVINLVNQSSMVGSLGNLYGSIENISDTYLQPNVSKYELLNPQVPFHSSNFPFLMPADDDGSETKKYYICNGDGDSMRKKYYIRNGHKVRCNPHRYISDDPTSICPGCKRSITSEAYYVAPVKEDFSGDEGGGGFVKGVVTYFVTDDLKVMPHSTISTINIMNQFNIKDFGLLEVKDVHLGVDEGLKILKAALHTGSVLTTVFLRK